ncbi:MAG: hypothetical protein ACRCUS_05080 [Anaerovoracaceae bacterium]
MTSTDNTPIYRLYNSEIVCPEYGTAFSHEPSSIAYRDAIPVEAVNSMRISYNSLCPSCDTGLFTMPLVPQVLKCSFCSCVVTELIS